MVLALTLGPLCFHICIWGQVRVQLHSAAGRCPVGGLPFPVERSLTYTRTVIEVPQVCSAHRPTPGPTGLTLATPSSCGLAARLQARTSASRLCSISRSFGRFRVPEPHLSLRRCISVSGRNLTGCCRDSADAAGRSGRPRHLSDTVSSDLGAWPRPPAAMPARCSVRGEALTSWVKLVPKYFTGFAALVNAFFSSFPFKLSSTHCGLGDSDRRRPLQKR